MRARGYSAHKFPPASGRASSSRRGTRPGAPFRPERSSPAAAGWGGTGAPGTRGRPHKLGAEIPVRRFPSSRGPTPRGAPNFLPSVVLWRGAAGRSPSGEGAERARRRVVPEKPLQPRPRARSGQVSPKCVSVRLRARAGLDLKAHTHTCGFVPELKLTNVCQILKGEKEFTKTSVP